MYLLLILLLLIIGVVTKFFSEDHDILLELELVPTEIKIATRHAFESTAKYLEGSPIKVVIKILNLTDNKRSKNILYLFVN